MFVNNFTFLVQFHIFGGMISCEKVLICCWHSSCLDKTLLCNKAFALKCVILSHKTLGKALDSDTSY